MSCQTFYQVGVLKHVGCGISRDSLNRPQVFADVPHIKCRRKSLYLNVCTIFLNPHGRVYLVAVGISAGTGINLLCRVELCLCGQQTYNKEYICK